MAVLDGCEGSTKTPILEERTCPQCGETIEVFTVRGRIKEDAKCDCGYVIKAEEQYDPKALERAETEKTPAK
ncbi:MAG: hypothetical protein IJ072_02195 [Oscillospiraceae bacterium]|nr:hypothetical protein [Oscillospiraceae bacterium]